MDGFTLAVCRAPGCTGADRGRLEQALSEATRTCPHGVMVVTGCLMGPTLCHSCGPASSPTAGRLAVIQPCHLSRTPSGPAVLAGPIHDGDAADLCAWAALRRPQRRAAARPAARLRPPTARRPAQLTRNPSSRPVSEQWRPSTRSDHEPEHRLGVRLYPSTKSIGVWALKTYLNGKPTPSGFNRPVVGAPYQPHGTVPAQLVRPGQVFTVRGAVFSQDGNEYLVVSTPCRTQ